MSYITLNKAAFGSPTQVSQCSDATIYLHIKYIFISISVDMR